jgi:hypothetical protein
MPLSVNLASASTVWATKALCTSCCAVPHPVPFCLVWHQCLASLCFARIHAKATDKFQARYMDIRRDLSSLANASRCRLCTHANSQSGRRCQSACSTAEADVIFAVVNRTALHSQCSYGLTPCPAVVAAAHSPQCHPLRQDSPVSQHHLQQHV